jgi:hypothetical protein
MAVQQQEQQQQDLSQELLAMQLMMQPVSVACLFVSSLAALAVACFIFPFTCCPSRCRLAGASLP